MVATAAEVGLALGFLDRFVLRKRFRRQEAVCDL